MMAAGDLTRSPAPFMPEKTADARRQPRSADNRPSPDALLEHAERETRGRLKIFLGAAPGVGKTYEMLMSGRAQDGRRASTW